MPGHHTKRPRLKEESASEKGIKASDRPIRQSAGRKSLPPGYVDSANAEGIEYSSDSGPEEGRSRKTWKQKVLGPTRPLSPSRFTELPHSSRSSSSEPEVPAGPASKMALNVPENVSLTFNVPPNHEGPFVVNLNLRDLGVKPSPGRPTPSHETPKKASSVSPKSRTKAHVIPSPAGFTDLPPELRNMIYEHLYDHGKVFDFGRPEFSSSSQFFRTCKLVYEEAAPILYSNNTFRLTRDSNTEGPYWKKPWVEVGFRNIRRWLIAIAPLNISYLRNVEISLEDGSPSRLRMQSTSNQWASENFLKEEARYVHDTDLIECLKILARYSQLRTFKLDFTSRKMLTRRDDRFLHALKKIKTDKLLEAQATGHSNYYGYRGPSRIEQKLLDELRHKMERSEKLYEEANGEEKNATGKQKGKRTQGDAHGDSTESDP
ncbi:MAG: hypothetical protein Q9162_004792 [Coniocarpon cinnabarinum]